MLKNIRILIAGAIASAYWLAIGAVMATTNQNTPEQGMEIPLWPDGKMPGPPAIEPEALTVHQKNWKYTYVPAPAMTVVRPSGAEEFLPAVLVCPGGGYGVLAYEKEGTEVAAWLNSIGFTAMILKYRVPKCREGALQDIQRAMRLARSHAKEWRIDPRCIGVIGFSAGGDLCVKLCAYATRELYPAVDAADKVSATPDFAVLVYPAFFEQNGMVDKAGRVESELMPTAATPPTFLVHTEDDAAFVNGTKIYNEGLERAGVWHQFLLCRAGGHGYGLRLQDKEADLKAWPSQCRQWLQGFTEMTLTKDSQ